MLLRFHYRGQSHLLDQSSNRRYFSYKESIDGAMMPLIRRPIDGQSPSSMNLSSITTLIGYRALPLMRLSPDTGILSKFPANISSSELSTTETMSRQLDWQWNTSGNPGWRSRREEIPSQTSRSQSGSQRTSNDDGSQCFKRTIG